MLHPWREVSKFSIVSVVSKPHLGSDEGNLSIIDNHATVVDDILVYDWPISWIKDRKVRRDE